MNEEFIPYEEALALKELGFDEKCFASWWNDQLVTDYIDQEEIDALSRPSAMSKNYSYMLAPLYQQAFRWFREKYNFVGTILGDGLNGKLKGYYYSITEEGWINYYESIDDAKWYDAYEEAELACLNKLIEISKPKEDE